MNEEKEARPRLQIIRGLPGSGKTTLALKRYPNLLRLETDMFFYSEGAYRFSMERNKQAVRWFKNAVVRLCLLDVDFVTTGVFAAHTERLDYVVNNALLCGYDVYIKTLTSLHKGIHGVPKEHLDAMKAAFVPEGELRKKYARFSHVHFGLMPMRYPLAHLAKQKGRGK